MAKAKRLPPDPEGMNDDRAEWALSAIRHFQTITGTDFEDALSDLLCDLMHACDRDPELGVFSTQLKRAVACYAEETMEVPQ